MIHTKLGGWHFAFHGVAFIGDIQQTSPRGADKFTSVNWFMGQARHRLAGGTFEATAMLSLDPATITGERYPELFQTGETAYGKPIVDGQHPHNFFMELALRYTHPLGEKTKLSLYFAPVGDPALGPVAFPHRVSASELPQPPYRTIWRIPPTLHTSGDRRADAWDLRNRSQRLSRRGTGRESLDNWIWRDGFLG